jgi:hypothetical protein
MKPTQQKNMKKEKRRALANPTSKIGIIFLKVRFSQQFENETNEFQQTSSESEAEKNWKRKFPAFCRTNRLIRFYLTQSSRHNGQFSLFWHALSGQTQKQNPVILFP